VLICSVAYAYASTPTYPSGSIGYLLASKTKMDLTRPQRELPNEEAESKYHLRFYSPDVHRAAFMLPNFAKKVTNS